MTEGDETFRLIDRDSCSIRDMPRQQFGHRRHRLSDILGVQENLQSTAANILRSWDKKSSDLASLVIFESSGHAKTDLKNDRCCPYVKERTS